MACSDSQIDKPQGGRSKRAELIDTGAQSINTGRTSSVESALKENFLTSVLVHAS